MEISLSFDHRRDFSLIPHSQPQKFSSPAVSSNCYKPGNFLVPCLSNDVFHFEGNSFQPRFRGQRRNENEMEEEEEKEEGKKREERRGGIKRRKEERVELIVAIDPPIIRSWNRR